MKKLNYDHNISIKKKLTVYFVFLIIFDDILSLGISNTCVLVTIVQDIM